jgi:hypothetical protein
MHRVQAPVMVERGQRENMLGAIEALFANGRGGRQFTVPSDRSKGDRRLLYSLTDLLRSVSVEASRVFAGHRVAVEATDEVAAALRGVGLWLKPASPG